MPTRSVERFLSINNARFERTTIYSSLFLDKIFRDNFFFTVLIKPVLFSIEKNSKHSAMRITEKMFVFFVKAFTIKSPAVLINPKNRLNLDTIIDPMNNPPIRGKITSSCQMRKKMPTMKGNNVINPGFSN